jgi:isopentenyl-diphosphate delta-isomerase
MPKVAPIQKRKADHIRINLEQDVRSSLSSGLEEYRFTHEALPEIALPEVDTGLALFGKKLAFPLLISSMTGGTREAGTINQRLARAAEASGIAMAVGSQRAAIEDPTQARSFTIARKAAPNILLFANLGAVQLNYGYGLEHCQRAVDMLEADALILHLNPLQEAVQPRGDTDFTGIAAKLEQICRLMKVPVIVKEVGWGISVRTARLLANSGVEAIDVAGAGGTSWSQVEMHRATTDQGRQLAASFIGWGIPTSQSILNVKEAAPQMLVIASGGLKDGLDVAKSVALGAALCGIAGPFLRAAMTSASALAAKIALLQRQLAVTMFVTGSGSLIQLAGKLAHLPAPGPAPLHE